MILEFLGNELLPLWNECLSEAVRVGEVIEVGLPLSNSMWFMHNLAMGTMLLQLPDESLISYEGSNEELIKMVVDFALRGIGMKEEILRKYSKPEIEQKKLGDILGPLVLLET